MLTQKFVLSKAICFSRKVIVICNNLLSILLRAFRALRGKIVITVLIIFSSVPSVAKIRVHQCESVSKKYIFSFLCVPLWPPNIIIPSSILFKSKISNLKSKME